MGSLFLAFIYTAVLLFSVALHELGHTVVAQRYGTKVQDILLTPIGGMARLTGLPQNPRHEVRIALAGPYVSLMLFLAGLSVTLLLFQLGIRSDLTIVFSSLNLMLFLFNLLPSFPMDGGRILRGCLTRKMGALEATRIARNIGKIMSFIFIFLGLAYGNYSLAVIGVFILMSAGSEYRMMQMKHWQEQQLGGHTMDAGEADFQASPPPYASAKGPTLPDNLLGDILITFKDLFEEICSSCFNRVG